MSVVSQAYLDQTSSNVNSSLEGAMPPAIRRDSVVACWCESIEWVAVVGIGGVESGMESIRDFEGD